MICLIADQVLVVVCDPNSLAYEADNPWSGRRRARRSRAMTNQILGVGNHDLCGGGIHVFVALCLQLLHEGLVDVGSGGAVAAAPPGGRRVQLGKQRIGDVMVVDRAAL